MPVKLARKLRVLMVLVAALGAAAVSVLAQAGAGAPQAPAAGQAAGGGRSHRPGPGCRSRWSRRDERAGLLAEAAGRAVAGRTGQEVLAAAGFQDGAGALGSGHRGVGADRLRRQRPACSSSSFAATCRTPTAAARSTPVGRISLHEDRNNDGVYESHNVFVDNLVFPRMVMPFGPNAILTKESNADELYKYTDTNNDGVADKKELFATGMGRLANVEHQESHFMWGMDNWIYSTYNAFRVRWTPTGVLREPTGVERRAVGRHAGQLRQAVVPGGRERHARLLPVPGRLRQLRRIRISSSRTSTSPGARPVLIADMQGGMNAVRMPDGSLARATGAAGNDVFRGDRLPKDMIGDYFYGEIVARIVRRLRPVKTEGLTQLRNVYPLSEFIRSTDPLFRPVDMTTAPDGTMYITDMYRGIIQESQWSGPGTYLRSRIEQYALDKVVRHGPHLAADLRQAWPRAPTAAHARRDLGPARRAPRPSERLVARHGAAAARAQAGQVRRAGAARRWRGPRPISSRAFTRSGRSKVSASADAALVRELMKVAGRADSPDGDPRERDALQGRRPLASATTTRALHDRRGRRRRHAGDDDAEHAEGR